MSQIPQDPKAKLKKLANDLVDEMLRLGETQHIQTWGVKEKPDEEIVVIVYRAKKIRSVRVREMVKSLPIVAGPSGNQCPLCGGSGKI